MDLTQLAPFWPLFPLLAAFLQATRLALTKVLSLDLPVPVLTLAANLASLLVTLPLVIWHHQFPFHDPVWAGALLAGSLLSGLGGLALTTAVARGEVSLVGPVMTLTPGIVVILEGLLIGDLPGPRGLFGLALLMAGAWLLTADEAPGPWYRPLTRLLSAPGSAWTVAAALCFAGAATFGRIGIARSDPLSFAVIVALINPLALWLFFSLREPGFHRQLAPILAPGRRGRLLLLGVLFALMRLADQIALSLTLASYAMAVKRTSALFAVLLGRWCFDEGHTRLRLAASVVMLLGLLALVV